MTSLRCLFKEFESFCQWWKTQMSQFKLIIATAVLLSLLSSPSRAALSVMGLCCWDHLNARGCCLERLYRRTGLAAHKDFYLKHAMSHKEAISNVKSANLSNLFGSHNVNNRDIISVAGSLFQPLYTFLPHMHSAELCHKCYVCLYHQSGKNRIDKSFWKRGQTC